MITFDQQQNLLAPFPAVDFRPGHVSGQRALALAYIDARDVMARLDAAVGGDWEFDWEPVTPDGKRVKGRLTVCGVTRCDAGEADREDEPVKSAVSDALKRCAVHFGVGRYLYHLPQVWGAYDPQKRSWSETPRISKPGIDAALARAGYEQPAPRPTPAAPPAKLPAPVGSAVADAPPSAPPSNRAALVTEIKAAIPAAASDSLLLAAIISCLAESDHVLCKAEAGNLTTPQWVAMLQTFRAGAPDLQWRLGLERAATVLAELAN